MKRISVFLVFTGSIVMAAPPAIATEQTNALPSSTAPQPWPKKIGAWTVEKLANDRPAAYVDRDPGSWSGDDLRSFRMECVAGGRLEYAPVGKPGLTVRTLRHDESGDDPDYDARIPLVRGRSAGAAAVKFARDLLKLEKSAAAGVSIGLPLVVNDQVMRSSTSFTVSGFSKARNFVLDECDRLDRAARSDSSSSVPINVPRPTQ